MARSAGDEECVNRAKIGQGVAEGSLRLNKIFGPSSSSDNKNNKESIDRRSPSDSNTDSNSSEKDDQRGETEDDEEESTHRLISTYSERLFRDTSSMEKMEKRYGDGKQHDQEEVLEEEEL